MTYLKSTILMVTLLLCLFGCKKNNKEQVQPITYPNYSQLKAGNYWIYREYKVAQTGMETETNVYDSCYIAKDTLINGLTYFKLVQPDIFFAGGPVLFLRDSLHYTVDNSGRVMFSSQDFGTVFNNDTVDAGTHGEYTVYTRMTDKDSLVTVPAGAYITSNFQRIYKFTDSTVSVINPRAVNTRYVKNIGIVLQDQLYYAGNTEHTEERLVRYHLN